MLVTHAMISQRGAVLDTPVLGDRCVNLNIWYIIQYCIKVPSNSLVPKDEHDMVIVFDTGCGVRFTSTTCTREIDRVCVQHFD